MKTRDHGGVDARRSDRPGRGEGCPSVGDLMAYLDGELSGEASRAIEEHISSCGHCTGLLRAQSHLESLYRESYREPLDEDFSAFEWRLRKHLKARELRGGGRPRWLPDLLRPGVLVPVAAALVAVVAAYKLLLPPGGSILREYVPGQYGERAAEEPLSPVCEVRDSVISDRLAATDESAGPSGGSETAGSPDATGLAGPSGEAEAPVYPGMDGALETYEALEEADLPETTTGISARG
ncbi:zf-HC2 domain-containing protein, partial [Candidatus Fermentibacterales bacterium]|nr:zf-HC2 domain-containing protein [Candidatus Fermentibacterales bacterium]